MLFGYTSAMIWVSRKWNLISLVILLLAGGWIALSAISSDRTAQELIAAPREGFLAPDARVLDASGQEIPLSSLRGKPVILNFWASWCKPCQAEMPTLQKIHQDYAPRGLIILGVNATYQDRASFALAFAQEMKLTFPIYFDVTGKAAGEYQVRALPSTYFIDAKGVIRKVVIGGPIAEALLRSQARLLLEEP